MAITLNNNMERLREQLTEAVRTKQLPWHEAEQIWRSKSHDIAREKEDEYFQRSMHDNFGPLASAKRSPPVRAAKEPTPNAIPSLVMPLSQLKALWAAKWGEQWVIPKSMDATEDVPFWWNAYQRLLQQGCFEVYTMGAVDWRRLKEESPLGNS